MRRFTLLLALALLPTAAAQAEKTYKYGVWEVLVKSNDFDGRTELLRARQNDVGLYLRCREDDGFNLWLASDTRLVDVPLAGDGPDPLVRWQVGSSVLTPKQPWGRGEIGHSLFVPDEATARRIVQAMKGTPSLRVLVGTPFGFGEVKLTDLKGFTQAIKHLSCLR